MDITRAVDYCRRVVDEGGNTPLDQAARFGLAALAAGYSLTTGAVIAAHRLGLRPPRRLPRPVVSVGNLSLGGTGKTPLVQWLARTVRASGRSCAIVCRGHGGSHRGPACVSDGRELRLSAGQAGDEAVEHALAVPGATVFIGRDRVAAGILACRSASPDVVILDDGFQYWSLHRDLDIVTVRATRPFENGRVLPRGYLREPPSRLRRADFVVLNHADGWTRNRAANAVAAMRRWMRLDTAAAVTSSRLDSIVGLDGSPASASGPWLAFCGIARPHRFFEMLNAAGVEVVRQQVFDDHHAYTLSDLRRLQRAAHAAGAEKLLTTAKDAAKLRPLHVGMEIAVAQARLTFLTGEHSLRQAVQAVIEPKH